MIGRAVGTVLATRGGAIEAVLPLGRVGAGVRVETSTGALAARITAVNRERVVLAPFGSIDGVATGDRVAVDPSVLALPLGTPLLGRAIDAGGKALDGRGRVRGAHRRVELRAPAPSDRTACDEPFWTGVRAIDGPLTIGRGARIGLFGPPGAGKSTLLEAIMQGASADAVVLALIGERGREAERGLAACDARMSIICATSDRAAAERSRAAELAFTQSIALRDRGLDVLLVLDSLARVAAAARETALAAGEPCGRGGYPPSVFASLARLLEVAGPAKRGSITVVATVLSDGPDEQDPLSEAARSLLDGHIVLSARLASAGRFPAIDLTGSASRTSAAVMSRPHRRAAHLLRAAVAGLDDSRDARRLRLDPTAGDPFLARAVAHEASIERFLRQGADPSAPDRTLTELFELADSLDDGRPL